MILKVLINLPILVVTWHVHRLTLHIKDRYRQAIYFLKLQLLSLYKRCPLKQKDTDKVNMKNGKKYTNANLKIDNVALLISYKIDFKTESTTAIKMNSL